MAFCPMLISPSTTWVGGGTVKDISCSKEYIPGSSTPGSSLVTVAICTCSDLIGVRFYLLNKCPEASMSLEQIPCRQLRPSKVGLHAPLRRGIKRELN